MLRLVRRVAIAIVVLALPPAAMAVTPPNVTVSGKISTLTARSITIKGAQKVTCRVARIVPSTLGLHVGLKAKATCTRGILVHISATPFAQPSSTPAATAGTPSSSSTPQASAAPAATYPASVGSATVNQGKVSLRGKGTLTAVGAGSISFGSIVCSLRSDSPDLGEIKIGEAVSFHCEGPFNGDTTAIPDGMKSGAYALTEISRL